MFGGAIGNQAGNYRPVDFNPDSGNDLLDNPSFDNDNNYKLNDWWNGGQHSSSNRGSPPYKWTAFSPMLLETDSWKSFGGTYMTTQNSKDRFYYDPESTDVIKRGVALHGAGTYFPEQTDYPNNDMDRQSPYSAVGLTTDTVSMPNNSTSTSAEEYYNRYDYCQIGQLNTSSGNTLSSLKFGAYIKVADDDEFLSHPTIDTRCNFGGIYFKYLDSDYDGSGGQRETVNFITVSKDNRMNGKLYENTNLDDNNLTDVFNWSGLGWSADYTGTYIPQNVYNRVVENGAYYSSSDFRQYKRVEMTVSNIPTTATNFWFGLYFAESTHHTNNQNSDLTGSIRFIEPFVEKLI